MCVSLYVDLSSPNVSWSPASRHCGSLSVSYTFLTRLISSVAFCCQAGTDVQFVGKCHFVGNTFQRVLTPSPCKRVILPCSSLRIRLRPRILRDVSVSDTRTTVQGTEISFPVGIAPTAFHCLAWHEGEMATARGQDLNPACRLVF